MSATSRLALACLAVVAPLLTPLTAPAQEAPRAPAAPAAPTAPGASTSPAGQSPSGAETIAAAPTPRRASLFDPARHMRVSEVAPGMKGYGLSVFHGTKIERFDVEVVSVARNFNPGLDAVFIMCKGNGMEHLGGVAGMSGSPIFLYDESGKARMIGAFAYGWNMAKDPLVGVQPIEYMLETADPMLPRAGSQAPVKAPAVGGRARWSYAEHFAVGGREPAALTELLARGAMTPANNASTRTTGLALSAGGISPAALEGLRPLLSAFGLGALQAGGAGGVGGGRELPREMRDLKPAIEPGSSLVVPLLSGDTEMAALGTCTEVIGDRVFGFGHPFMSEGGTRMPMAAGYVNTIVASLVASFKLGGSTQVLGTLQADTGVGIGGVLGVQPPPRTPLSVRVFYADGTMDRTYRFEAVRHPRFSPLLTTIATLSSLTAERELPARHTLDLSVRTVLTGGRELRLTNSLVDARPVVLFMSVGMPILALGENPFERLEAERVEVEVRVTPDEGGADLMGARPTRSRYHPGETVAIDATYRPAQQPERTMRLELPLPADLEPGEYQVVVSDAERFQGDEAQARPDLFIAEDVGEMVGVINRQGSRDARAVFVRLVRAETGVAVGTVAMPGMPGSKRQLIEASGRENIAAVAPTTFVRVKTEHVMAGSSEFAITVESRTPGKKATHTAHPQPPRMPSGVRPPQQPPMQPPTLPEE